MFSFRVIVKRRLSVLETMYRLHPRGAANRGVCVDAEGAMLGPDCVLVQRAQKGYRAAPRGVMRDIQDCLIERGANADWLYQQSRRIADALDSGNVALAQIYGLRIQVKELDDRQLKQLAAIAPFVRAGFNPDEPRIPAGQPGGGEWTDGSDGGPPEAATDAQASIDSADIGIRAFGFAGSANDANAGAPMSVANEDEGNAAKEGLEAQLIQAGYNLSSDLLAVMRALYQIYVTPGSTIASLQEYLAENGINFDELPSVIKSLFDDPKPLGELQTNKPPAGFLTEAQLKAYLGDPPPGYEWHHIIEQNGQFRPDLTSPEGIQEWIQNTDNMVAVPVIKHYCVSGIMSSTPEKGSGVRVRDVLKIHNPTFQRLVGLGFLRMCGAIQ
jgi:hypothetical protein